MHIISILWSSCHATTITPPVTGDPMSGNAVTYKKNVIVVVITISEKCLCFIIKRWLSSSIQISSVLIPSRLSSIVSACPCTFRYSLYPQYPVPNPPTITVTIRQIDRTHRIKTLRVSLSKLCSALIDFPWYLALKSSHPFTIYQLFFGNHARSFSTSSGDLPSREV